MKKSILLILPIIFMGFQAFQDFSIGKLIGDMEKSINNIQTLRYTLRNTERINGTLLVGEQLVKYAVSPRRCYLYLKKPSKGAELLYVEGQNNGQALYEPNGFPFFQLNLEPMGFLMRKNNHHTIHEIGFSYIGNLIKDFHVKNPDNFFFMGEKTWNNKRCFHIVIRNDNFKIMPYKAKRGDSVLGLAKRMFVSEYMILELNESLEDYDDLQEGDEILLPNSYAQKVELYIDKEHNLPLSIKIFDDKGLFEMYEYFNLEYNPFIDNAEFSKEMLGKKIYAD